MRKYIVEFIGTFFLVLTIGCTGLPGHDFAAVAIGAVLMVMVYAGGHVSGAHYNPAVTLAVWLRGKCTTAELAIYIPTQIAAAFLAALVAIRLTALPPAKPLELNVANALLAEFLYTFALAYVVLNVATAKGTSGNSFYGLAIGFTVLAGAVSVGGISGGAFNPAVAVAISVMGMVSWANIWIYLVANLAGGGLAGLIFTYLNPEDA